MSGHENSVPSRKCFARVERGEVKANCWWYNTQENPLMNPPRSQRCCSSIIVLPRPKCVSWFDQEVKGKQVAGEWLLHIILKVSKKYCTYY